MWAADAEVHVPSLLLTREGWVLFELSLGQQDTGGTSCPSLPHPQGFSRGFLTREVWVLFWVQVHSGQRGLQPGVGMW